MTGAPLPGIPTALAYVAAVTIVIGLALFALPPFGHMPLAHQLMLAGLLLGLWSFGDGLFGRFSVILAFVEAVLLLRLSVGWTRLFVDAFGAP